MKHFGIVLVLTLSVSCRLYALSPDEELLQAAWLGNLNGVENALSRGADIETVNEAGWTALIRAANQGHTDIVRLLLENGADIEASTSLGTALVYAVWNGHTGTVALLLEQGAAVEYYNSRMKHPLVDAALIGRNDIIFLLLQRGVEVDLRDNILGYGSDGTFPETDPDRVIVLLYEDYTLPVSPLNSFRKTRELQLYPEREWFPLSSASPLLSHATPLIWAALNGHVDTVKLLFEKGADINAVDNFSYYPLWVAVNGGHEELVDYLLKNGAEFVPEGSDLYLFMPSLVSLAREKGYEGIVELLLAAGGW